MVFFFQMRARKHVCRVFQFLKGFAPPHAFTDSMAFSTQDLPAVSSEAGGRGVPRSPGLSSKRP